jgi:hypothetical protein
MPMLLLSGLAREINRLRLYGMLYYKTPIFATMMSPALCCRATSIASSVMFASSEYGPYRKWYLLQRQLPFVEISGSSGGASLSVYLQLDLYAVFKIVRA